MSDFDSRDNKQRPNSSGSSPDTDWEALLQDTLPEEVDRRSPGNLADLFADADLVFVYTRAQALADGTLVDVSETAREAGFIFPVAVTAALWNDIEDIPEEHAGYQTPEDRLWDVLYMASLAIRQSKGNGSMIIYPLIMPTEETPGEEEYRVKLICGPGDEGEPVMTLMKPGED